MAFEHELSWSVSRAGNFATCRRRYYYDYYASWNGWLDDASAERRRAYLLKKMTRMPMLAGDALHRGIAEYFDRRSEGRAMDEGELAAFALSKLRRGYKESRDGLWRNRPSRYTHLAEHQYAEACIDESTGAAGDYGKRFVERIREGTRYFFSAPELARAREAAPGSILGVEGRAPGDRRAKGMDTITLFGTKTYAIPDLALELGAPQSGEGGRQLFVYDWKTGSPREQDAFQLGVYVLYAVEKWRAAPEQVTCFDAYLTRGELVSTTFDEAALEPVLARVERSLAQMRELHFDAGPSAGDPAAFPPLEDEASHECANCNYRELCGRAELGREAAVRP